METVVKSILAALEKNGFPEKKVTLPFQAIFKSCKAHETTLASVLNHLQTTDVLHEMVGDRILFFHRTLSPAATAPRAEPSPVTGPEIPEELYAEAMEKLKAMDPEEVERIKAQVLSLSPEEQADLMKRAAEIFQKNEK
ncbi:MAG: hypothetical protein ABIK68_24350 [bacterium]